ncbi:uncharacterized protein [Trachinotus anak]|uniref:uncharacterized protein isoform X2 n=1 Tax=Trachinotus anak TaxID=443729 RepID=UPI0039F20037
MKLLLRSLLLASLCAISSWSESSTGTVVVTQTPDVSVMEGDTVSISCCWTEKSDRTRINWWKETEIKTKRYSFKNETQESQKNESSSCSTLIFSNITTNDSARYICRVNVEIPVLTFGEGNGTVITVTAREKRGGNTDDDQNPGPASPTVTIIVAVAVAVPLLLTTLVCFCVLRRRQAQAVRVIYEVPHVDSEEAEMDKHSTSSSRGSSQWCQVPVYESFDYFERVQTKESG